MMDEGLYFYNQTRYAQKNQFFFISGERDDEIISPDMNIKFLRLITKTTADNGRLIYLTYYEVRGRYNGFVVSLSFTLFQLSSLFLLVLSDLVSFYLK